MNANLRVHIAPVGFQFKRITEPLIKMRADKVYLLTLAPDDEASHFLEQVKQELKSQYGVINMKEEYADLWDPLACLEKMRKIISDERLQGNHIYVNVSTGTKITAIAGMLACMLWEGTPYYSRVAYPKRKKPEPPPSEIVDDPQLLPVYDITKPRTEHLIILGMLKSHGGKMRKGRLIELLENRRTIGPKVEVGGEFTEAAKHSQLRSMLEPMLKEWKFVKVEASGRRSEVMITDQGETALRIFGTAESDKISQ